MSDLSAANAEWGEPYTDAGPWVDVIRNALEPLNLTEQAEAVYGWLADSYGHGRYDNGVKYTLESIFGSRTEISSEESK